MVLESREAVLLRAPSGPAVSKKCVVNGATEGRHLPSSPLTPWWTPPDACLRSTLPRFLYCQPPCCLEIQHIQLGTVPSLPSVQDKEVAAQPAPGKRAIESSGKLLLFGKFNHLLFFFKGPEGKSHVLRAARQRARTLGLNCG